MARNSSVLMLESIGVSKFAVSMSGKCRNDANIGTFTFFSSSILSLLDDKKKKDVSLTSVLEYHSLINEKILDQD